MDMAGTGRSLYWTLDENHNPVPANDVAQWARWFSTCNRVVKFERIGTYEVSTVFLGIDHGFSFLPGNEQDPPILFETMTFRPMTHKEQANHVEVARDWGFPALPINRESMDCERCSTWDQAIAQHERMARSIRILAAG